MQSQLPVQVPCEGVVNSSHTAVNLSLAAYIRPFMRADLQFTAMLAV